MNGEAPGERELLPGNEPIAPTYREGGTKGAEASPTMREGSTGSAHPSDWLPGPLAQRFRVVGRLPAMGREARLRLVEDNDTGARLVAKVYHEGIVLKPRVLELLRTASQHHVVELHEYGESDGYWYEILEYIEGGSLRDLLDTEGSRLPPHLVEGIIREVADALEHWQGLGVIHRDLKPENILVRNRETLDLVLGDLGLAVIVEGTRGFGTVATTWEYAGPEAFQGLVGTFRDWWSLGMIVLEALTGEHPLMLPAKEDSGVVDSGRAQAISYELWRQPVDLSEVEDERWRVLLKGLLTRDPELRWGANEVTAWLKGESPEVHFDQALPSDKGFPMGDSDYLTPSELATGLARNWDEGKEQMARGNILHWLRSIGEYRLANRAADLEESVADINARLFRLILELDPHFGERPSYMGFEISPDELTGLAAEAVREPESEAARAVASMYENRILSLLDSEQEA